ncbi:Adenylate cyclase [Chryseobacterium taihuense]|uniref:Adenylate cyclase n=1 Tax=Chryseobacterium taihuense TaxID=1141221 RepID=A0A4U8W9G6_9FLAO|nr:Adenylate cyclase [Chryseobacterium taihuense]
MIIKFISPANIFSDYLYSITSKSTDFKYKGLKKSLLLRVLYIAILLLQHLYHAQNSAENFQILNEKEVEEGFVIEGKCKFSTDDNTAFAQTFFNDSQWKLIDFTSRDLLKKNQVYWFRYHFKIDSSLIGKPLFLEINQSGASEIFLNGKKIKTLGKIGAGEKQVSKIKDGKPLIISFDSTEKNVLAIRFKPTLEKDGVSSVNFGSKAINIVISPANSYVEDKMFVSRNINFYTMLICGIFLALGFIHLLLFIFYRKAVYNFYFSTYNLSICTMSYMVLLIYEIEDPSKFRLYLIIALYSLIIFGASLTGFVNTLFGKSRLRFRIMLAIPVLLIIIQFFSPEISFIFCLLYLFFAAMESFYLIIRAMIKREKSAFIVGGGILTFFLFTVITLVIFLLDSFNILDADNIMDTDGMGYFALFVFISFPVSISAYLAWQFAATNLSLKKQLDEVNRLSEINLLQEQEKKHILQNQNDILEKQVDERTKELQVEKHKTETLLLNILPQEVAEELKENGSSEAKYYDEVTVLFTDFVNFTQNSEKMGAEKMLAELNDCFTAFDLIMEKHGLEKIKTIGDAYLSVCGLPNQNPKHAYQTVLAALDILQFIEERKKTNPETLEIRIGINSGSLVAGIVGLKKFAYDIWGDTVNTAARMEQNSEKGKINISESTYQLIKDKVICEYRGKIDTKGKGAMDMYFALQIKNN